LYAAAIVEHEHHADGEALRRLEQILSIGRSLDGDHTLIGHLVGLSIQSIGNSGIEYLAPSLQLDSPDARARVSELTQLQDRKVRDSSATLGLRGEYTFVQQIIQDSGQNAWWIRPLGIDECRRTMHTFSSYVDSWADNWPECNRHLNSAMASAINYSRQMSSLELVAIGTSNNTLDPRGYFRQQFRTATDAAAAQLLLASRMYLFKQGVYPQAARDVVPEFLAAVPIDPFSSEHAPMRYRLDARGPTIWSVGENGTDEGAPVKMDPHDPEQRIRRYGQPDIVYGAAWASAPTAPDPNAPAASTPSP
jgi:hypothetical protein